MAKTSPTQRSLKYLRAKGYVVDICEKWNAYTRTRKDLFGVLDLVCLGHGTILGVQTTSGPGSSRITKILAEPRAKVWLENGGKITVHGWSLRGARGCRKRWTVREVEITLADYGNESTSQVNSLSSSGLSERTENVGAESSARSE